LTISLKGSLQKMRTVFKEPIEYYLPIGEVNVPLNDCLGKTLSLYFTGDIQCINCSQKTSKSFHQGHCFPCFRGLAACDLCVLKPEKCHYFEGTCREPAWGETYCMQPHIVYLANTGQLKVGITRQSQIPTRWIDQGAEQALPIFKTSRRQISGFMEVAIAHVVSDQTNWRLMLKGKAKQLNLAKEAEQVIKQLKPALEQLTVRFKPEDIEWLTDQSLYSIVYPIHHYPEKIQSLSVEKNPSVKGQLLGIKGQYLLLDTGVINIRKYGGYQVEFQVT